MPCGLDGAIDMLSLKNSQTSSPNNSTTSRPTSKLTPKAPEGNPYYEIRAIPDKGYGCFALKDIKRGTRILTDKPLLIVPKPDYLLEDIEEAAKKLSPEELELYFSLSSSHGQDPTKWPSRVHASVQGRELQRIREQHLARISPTTSLTSIFQTNCMEMGLSAAVFPHASRINHSCNPNCNFTWNALLALETVHAIADIPAGAELTFSYCDMTKEKTLRAWELKHYGFSCDCRACAGDGGDPESFAHQSAERRFRIHELDRATKVLRGARLGEGARTPGFVNQLLELAQLHREEGDYSIRLARIYLDLALVCEIASDWKNGVECAANAVKVKRECQGADSPDYDKYEDVLRRIYLKSKAAMS
ncbi:SET domain-containing protein [Lentithecium fluviatile CBS 122367]|uniref:SET domain-containing protein n=1 Tax=Lentithecium fluviatile CBS 122367 TaxID=1168545 RepID=A0A6G1J8Y4_9PLEO|nr:SET domain-containing protein [Lentithecium fluviatile CBS 122367]